jgi:hypothetical protein
VAVAVAQLVLEDPAVRAVVAVRVLVLARKTPEVLEQPTKDMLVRGMIHITAAVVVVPAVPGLLAVALPQPEPVG